MCVASVSDRNQIWKFIARHTLKKAVSLRVRSIVFSKVQLKETRKKETPLDQLFSFSLSIVITSLLHQVVLSSALKLGANYGPEY